MKQSPDKIALDLLSEEYKKAIINKANSLKGTLENFIMNFSAEGVITKDIHEIPRIISSISRDENILYGLILKYEEELKNSRRFC